MFPRILRGRVVGMSLIVLAMSIGTALAQGTGTIKGVVRDRTTKDHLPGAHVVVKGTSLGAATNLDGVYIIRNVPAGEQMLVATYVGYISASLTVQVPADGEHQQDFALIPTTIEGAEVIVTAQGQGQLQAINQQLTSDKIVSVVSESKIQELPDFNAAQAIARLPGVSTLTSSGEANKVVIRGLAPQYNQVAIGGVSLASTGNTQIGITSLAGGQISSDRSVDLTMVTPYMVKSISVYKTLTPDMNANAVGGLVNMELREAPSEFHTDLMWQSGYTNKTREYGNYRTILSASDRFFDGALGIYLLGNAEKYDRASDNMAGTYNIPNTTVKPDGYKAVQVSNVGLTRHIETRKRYGGNAIIDYALPAGSIRSVNMFSRLDANVQEYQTLLRFSADGSGNIDFSFRDNQSKTDLAVNSLEFENDFGFMSASIKVANTYSRNHLPAAPFFQFRQTGGIYTAGVSMLDVQPENLVSRIAYSGPANTYLNTVSVFSSDYKENDQIYKADFKIPLDLGSDISGSIKAGGEFRHNFRRNSQSTPYLDLRRGGTPISNAVMDSIRAHFPVVFDSSSGRFPAYNFNNMDKDLLAGFLGDRFGGIMWVTDPTLIRMIVDYTRSDPQFNAAEAGAINPGGWYDGPFQHLPNNYKYIEKYYAGYAMADLSIGPDLKVVGGARFEQIRSLYEAFNLMDGRNPLTQNVFPVTVYPQNRYLLPMAHAKYQITDWLDVRYAYTQTLARPDYHQLSPHISMTNDRLNVYSGNPRLTPGRAYNHDLQFTVHDNTIGFITVGAFYKTVSGFTYATQYKLYQAYDPISRQYYKIPPGLDSLGMYTIGGTSPGIGANLYTYINSPYDAFLKGLEADIQMRLWYLPAPFDGTVVGLNYTHIWSSATYPWVDTRTVLDPITRTRTLVLIDSTRTGRLIYQPNDVFNAYIGYDYGGFSARVSFVFQGNSVSGIGIFAEQDGFTKDYFRIDASARQMLPVEGLQLFLDLNNLNARKNQAAQASIGGFTSENNYGMTANLGVRFTL